jgi:hypothetical protein
MDKYSQLSVRHKAYEICFYWKDANGIETLDGLYGWESRDWGNRRLFRVDDHAEAQAIVSSKKLINQYI